MRSTDPHSISPIDESAGEEGVFAGQSSTCSLDATAMGRGALQSGRVDSGDPVLDRRRVSVRTYFGKTVL